MPLISSFFLFASSLPVLFPPLPSPNNNSNNEGGGQKQICKMIVDVEQGESLFDTVPDEIVEKILLVVAEEAPLWTAAASLTCQRFHS